MKRVRGPNPTLSTNIHLNLTVLTHHLRKFLPLAQSNGSLDLAFAISTG